MDLEMVLNELSLHPLAADVYDARQRMTVLLQTISVATRHGVKRILRTSSHFVSEELAPGYSVAKWLNDTNVDRELQRFFRRIITKSPFLADIAENGVLESFGLSDYFWGEKQAVGLGVVFLLDAIAVSLRSDPCWFECYLQLKVSRLDDSGEITDVFEGIPHASCIDHINIHLPWINKRLQVNAQSDVHEGLDIWLHKEEWFPHLYFCEQVKEQLQTLSRGHLMLMPILKRLYELESYGNNWLDGSFDSHKMVSKATPESVATLEMYRLERTFRCHDGISRVFSWHVRLTLVHGACISILSLKSADSLLDTLVVIYLQSCIHIEVYCINILRKGIRMKLNQVIAIEKGTKSRSLQELTEAHHKLQKLTLLAGISRIYRPKDEEGEQFPPESTRVQIKADDIIRETSEALIKLFDVVATKDWANCQAKADIVVDGNVLLARVCWMLVQFWPDPSPIRGSVVQEKNTTL